MYLCILRDKNEHILETFVVDCSQIGELINQFHSGHWQIKEIGHEKFNDNVRKRT